MLQQKPPIQQGRLAVLQRQALEVQRLKQLPWQAPLPWQVVLPWRQAARVEGMVHSKFVPMPTVFGLNS